MNRDTLRNGLTAWLCGFLLSFGGTAAMATGFQFADVRLISLGFFCFLFSGLCALAFSVKKGPLVLLCLLAVTGGFALRYGQLLPSIKTLTWQISNYYDSGYHWGVVPWGAGVRADKNPAILLVSMLPALCITWAVCRRKRLTGFLPLSLLPLFSCFVLTDTVPEIWCIILLTAGVFLLVLTQTARRRSLPGGNRLTALALIPVLLISLLLPRIAPQEKFDKQMAQLQSIGNRLSFLQDLFKIDGSFSGSVASDRISLAHTGPILDLYYTVMTVEADFSGTVYLRQRSYDRYDGKYWDTSSAAESAGDWPGGLLTNRLGILDITTRVKENALYVPYYAYDRAYYSDMRYGMIPNREDAVSYSFVVMDLNDAAVTPRRTPYDVWTGLPEKTLAAAQKILADNNLTTVEEIVDFVRNSAEYDKRTPAMPGGESDFAIWFLEQAETGYCVHFATAAVVLLRAAGFNARYVTGYTTSLLPGRPVRVTAERAHAWVELLDEYYGWVVLDPTPGNGQTDIETEPPITEPTQNTEPSESTDPSESTEPSQNTTEPPESTAPSQDTAPDVDTPEVDLSLLVTLLRILAGAAGLCALLWGQYRLRRNARSKRQHTGKPNAQAIARWQELRLLSRLLKQEPEEAMLILAEKARFSQHELSKEELFLLQQAINTLQQSLGAKPWYQKLWLKLVWAL